MNRRLSVQRIRSSFDSHFPRDQGSRTNETMIVSIPIEDDDDVLCDEEGKKKKKNRREIQDGAINLLSLIYAMCIILFGSLFPITEALRDTWLETHSNGVFLVYIYGVATAFIVYLQVYLIPRSRKKHQEAERKRKENVMNKLQVFKNENERQFGQQLHQRTRSNSFSDSVLNPSFLTEADITDTSGRLEQYSPTKVSPDDSFIDDQKAVERAWLNVHEIQELLEHEGSSFYVRFGILLFSIGNMIYIGLELDYYIFGDVPDKCLDDLYGWTFFLRLLFVLAQTFFLLKNAKVHASVQKSLVKFGFMHMIATNFCVWFRTLIRETWIHIQHAEHENGTSAHGLFPDDFHVDDDDCLNYRQLLNITTPYLFPFVLEYSLTAMGIFAIMFLEVGHGEQSEFIEALRAIVKKSYNKIRRNSTAKRKRSNTIFEFEGSQEEVHERNGLEGSRGPLHTSGFNRTSGMSLEKSNRGMFLGFIFLAGIFISMLLFFVDDNNGDEVNSNFIYLVQDLVLHSAMLIATVAAMIYLDALPVIFKAMSVDDFVLLISLGGALFLEMSELMLAVSVLTSDYDFGEDKTNFILASIAPTVASVQSILQTILIVGGLRRYTDAQCLKECEEKRNKMPGREYITFLVVMNVTVWIFRSVLVREVNQDIAIEFYGELAWLFISNINLPLLLFFKFHSSVCCAEIWASAYKPVSIGFNGFEPLPQNVRAQSDNEQQSIFEEDEIKKTTFTLASPPGRSFSNPPFTIQEHDDTIM